MILLLLILLGMLIWQLAQELNSDYGSTRDHQYFCPSCGEQVDQAWGSCPYCHELLKEPCPDCDMKKRVGQNYCPYCGCRTFKESA